MKHIGVMLSFSIACVCTLVKNLLKASDQFSDDRSLNCRQQTFLICASFVLKQRTVHSYYGYVTLLQKIVYVLRAPSCRTKKCCHKQSWADAKTFCCVLRASPFRCFGRLAHFKISEHETNRMIT